MPNQALLDSSIAFQLDLHRFDAGTRAEIIKMLEQMQRDIIGRIANEPLTNFRATRLTVLLAEINSIVSQYYAETSTLLTIQATAASQAVAVNVTQGFAAALLPAPILPSASVLAASVETELVHGAVMKEWWLRQAADVQWRFKTEIQQGIASGEANGAIITRVKNTLQRSRANAASLVQTSISSIANGARQRVYDANTDVIDTLRWVTALDSHVCNLCAARADKLWNAGTHEPVGHSIKYQQPPIHFNDRCIIAPVAKTFAELGIDLPEPTGGTRASSVGQVPVDTTFDGFLKRRGTAFQNEVLGKGRADLWRNGKITLSDLISGNGRPLTLAQLNAKYK